MTETFELRDIEMQGSVLGPIKCSNQVDTLGKECQMNNENLYNYKGTTLPPLSYIDDLATISECGQKSLKKCCLFKQLTQSKEHLIFPFFQLTKGRDPIKIRHFSILLCQNQLEFSVYDLTSQSSNNFLSKK